ncbi:MAG: uracil-DNA glycosylase, partial [Deltaproteobacteria bacterium]|nr:uracil-DNA glycosylase [Deltaproteobacteria bacterium]
MKARSKELLEILSQCKDYLSFRKDMGLGFLPASFSSNPKPHRTGVSPVEVRSSEEHIVSQKQPTLADVRRELGDCRRCKLHKTRTNIVFGAGNERAKLVFVGEGPGLDEDIQGEPFVGAAGQLLTRIIQAINLRREDVYICNIIKCRPPKNRNPEPDEIEACKPFVLKQLDVIRPRL